VKALLKTSKTPKFVRHTFISNKALKPYKEPTIDLRHIEEELKNIKIVDTLIPLTSR